MGIVVGADDKLSKAIDDQSRHVVRCASYHPNAGVLWL
jgi:hypothetical protein